MDQGFIVSLWQFATENWRLLAIPLAAITVMIEVMRWGIVYIYGDKIPEKGTALDHGRRWLLFLSPFFVGILWMWAVSGLTIGTILKCPVYTLKQIILGGIFLGATNTFIYIFIWKPFIREFIVRKLQSFTAPKASQ